MEGSLSLLDLPEDIIHHIFSHLSNQQAIQSSLVSKQFWHVLQIRPSLVFNYHRHQFQIKPPPKREPDRAIYIKRHADDLDYVVSTLERYCRENIHLESLTLQPNFWLVTEDDIYNRCIESAAKCNVRKLRVWIKKARNHAYTYILPRVVFKVDSLVDLELTMCCLRPERRVVWPKLKRLRMDRCVSTEEGFEYIIRGCPSIENLFIMNCYSFGSFIFKLPYLHNLKELHISTPSSSESVECCLDRVDFGNIEYPNLTNLELHCCELDDRFFTDFAHKFPKLRTLSLRCTRIQRINLSSTSLRELVITNFKSTLLDVCLLDLPNLVRFEYKRFRSERFPKLSFAGNSSSKWSSRVELVEDKRYIDASWFLELNRFLSALNKSETSIRFEISDLEEDLINFNEENLIISNHVNLRPIQGIKEFFTYTLTTQSAGFSCAFLDCILLICQPQTLTFPCCENYEIPGLFYKKLIMSTNSVTGFEMSHKKKRCQSSARFKDWDEFLEALEDAEDISFHLTYC